MNRKKIIEEFMSLPYLDKVIEQIQEKMSNEKEMRALFYEQITDQEKAEFINGEIIMHSPATSIHSFVCLNIGTILQAYTNKHQLGRVYTEKIMIRLTRNDYEPDVCFFGKEHKAHTKKQTLFPAPDLVVEILSPSTAHRDKGIKYKDYQNHGVKEYWIVDTDNEWVEQYHLILDKFNEYKYELIGKLKKTETLESYAIEGLKLPIDAIFDTHQALEIDRKEIREESIEKGIKQGIEKGKTTKEKEIVLNALQKGFSHEMIAQFTGLSIEQIEAIEKESNV